MLSALLLVPLLSSTGCSYLFMSPTPGPLISDYTNYNIIYFVIQHTLLSMLGVRRNFISTCQINIILIIWGLLSAYCFIVLGLGRWQTTDMATRNNFWWRAINTWLDKNFSERWLACGLWTMSVLIFRGSRWSGTGEETTNNDSMGGTREDTEGCLRYRFLGELLIFHVEAAQSSELLIRVFMTCSLAES